MAENSEDGASEDGLARKNPLWMPAALTGRMPPIEPRLVSLLGAVALALFFEFYDFQIFNAALKQIGDSLQIADQDLGYFAGAVRFGGVLGFFLIPLADSLGRRRMFMISVIGFSIGTFLTAFSQTQVQFIACQLIARAFMATGAAVTFVIVTEEFPAAHRGWAVGVLAAIASFGHALGAAFFGAIEFLPYGWRALYVIGALPIMLIPKFKVWIYETRRFEEHTKDSGDAFIAWFDPIKQLILRYPARTLGLAIGASLSAASHTSVFLFISKFVQEVHQWEPWRYTAMFVFCGAFGTAGSVFMGRLSDRIGRKAVGISMLATFPVFSAMFYASPGWLMPVGWVLIVFGVMSGNMIMRAFATELFPTSYRGTATGWLFLLEAVGASLGLALVSIFSVGDSLDTRAILMVSMAVLGAAVAVAFFPETRSLELEEISEHA